MSKTNTTIKSTRTARKGAIATVSTTTSVVKVDRTLVQAIQERVITLLDRKNGEWTGTMTQLNAAITSGIRRVAVPANWPSTPSVLRRVVNRVVPSLRRAGVRVQFSRTTDHARTRVVSIVRA